MTTHIRISEVGPRDGLQSISRVMSTDAKKAWIAAEAAAGVTEIEVGSFVPPSLLPQMADTAEIVAFAKTLPGLDVAVLVPNLKGAERAIKAGAHKMSIPFSMSESHSIRNVRKDHAAMVEQIAAIAAMVAALPEGQRPHFEVGLSTAFGCTIEGPIPDDQIVRLAEQAIAAGAAEVCLSDTTGYANPAQVRRLVRAVKAAVGADRLNTLHLHNTRGLGLANVVAGLEEGITTFDSSMGGLGGCPFAPGASGNIVTEDLVFMLEAMGLHTGIDIARLGDVRQIIADALPGEPLYGFVPDAGVPLGFERVAA
ncbi:hydroxymethylglutaryl-CoA lyase [Novosphingobium sp. ERW19]|uniref:hydroxymethylglutaryl-CoA lyase n=1 Tax=Novosphingobium sp. ERW19 TaxID=2726186 RepID=UPI001456EE7C|nr:hydroxymethylglutaryl-CoA lyase [Novosphingobium sp. ERW19]NLR40248.1 hydroxymethylglutaryl-CoA lyase [Novosphingobium sp. ERW19]